MQVENVSKTIFLQSLKVIVKKVFLGHSTQQQSNISEDREHKSIIVSLIAMQLIAQPDDGTAMSSCNCLFSDRQLLQDLRVSSQGDKTTSQVD